MSHPSDERGEKIVSRHGKIVYQTSSDGGRSWSPPRFVLEQRGYMTKTRPLRLADGALLLPIYHEASWCPMVAILEGDRWRLYGDTLARGIAIQPAVAPLDDGSLLMYTRTNRGRIWSSRSFNLGRSWIASSPTPLPNPNSAVDLLRTAEGHLLLAYNDLTAGRNRLSLALSTDGGRTWGPPYPVVEQEGEFSYPFLCDDQQGTLHLVFTWQRVKIHHVSFRVEDLRARMQTGATPPAHLTDP